MSINQISVSPTQCHFIFLMAVLLTIAVYFPGLSGGYMFDDQPNLVENSRLDIESLDMESLWSASMSSFSGLLGRPVSMLSFALNRYFFSIDPYSHKVVNLIIHLLTGLLLYVLSRQLVASYKQFRKPDLDEKTTLWLPLIVSALWLVHPLNLTGVLYIVQRMASLSALFTVCGLCVYLGARQRMMAGKGGFIRIIVGFLVFGGLAVFSKESGALLPVYMLVLELCLFRFRSSTGGIDKAICSFFGLVVLLPACAALIWLTMNPDYIAGGFMKREFTLGERLFTELRVLVFYLKLILMPSVNALGLYHDDIVISRGLLDPPATLYSLFVLLGLLLAAGLLLRKQPLFSLGILWFFTGHILESTILPLEIAHEHRNYLADFGIILSVSSLLATMNLGKVGRLIKTSAPVIALFLFSYTTWVRAEQWSNSSDHAIYEAEHHPNSYRAVLSAGMVHMRLAIKGNPESISKAYTLLGSANELSATDISANVALIKLSYHTGRRVRNEWFDEVFNNLSVERVTPVTVNSLFGLITCMENECAIPHAKVEKMFALILNNPTLPAVKRRHAEVFHIYGYYKLVVREDSDTALAQFKEAVKIDPDSAQRWVVMINLLIHMDRLEEAELQLSRFKKQDTRGGNENDIRRIEERLSAERGSY